MGRTKALRRCKNETGIGYCRVHRWQPLAVTISGLSLLALFFGLYQDAWKPILGTPSEDSEAIFRMEDRIGEIDQSLEAQRLHIARAYAVPSMSSSEQRLRKIIVEQHAEISQLSLKLHSLGEQVNVYELVLVSSGENRISVIKEIRALIPGTGLSDAKNMVDAAPNTIFKTFDPATLDEVRLRLEAIGATVAVNNFLLQ